MSWSRVSVWENEEEEEAVVPSTWIKDGTFTLATWCQCHQSPEGEAVAS